MGSHSSFETGLDRKLLRKPDGFISILTSVFSEITSHTSRVVGVLVFLFLLGLGAAFWMNTRDATLGSARNALYSAEKTYQSELKPLLSADKKINYQKILVETHFVKTIALLKQVEGDFQSTAAAYAAQMKLGQLYFEHSGYEQALPWFQKAADHSKGWDRAVALSSLGYTYENMGRIVEAVHAYQTALNLGEGSMKGELLLGMARCYEASHDMAQARSTYDQILKDLPNTDTARTAEFYKSQLSES